MKSYNLLITFASWEDRFRLGFDRNLKNGKIHKVLIFYFCSYAERTEANRNKVEEICWHNDIEYISRCLAVDKPADNWLTVIDSVESALQNCQGIQIDISTMPREIIWYVLWLTEKSSTEIRYVYHSPESYGNDWLSRDPQAPRLVYKLSGIASPSGRTALLVTVGFDLQRARRLINWYEPAKLMIGLQSESLFRRNDDEMKVHRDTLEKEYDCTIFELDAFAQDQGMAILQRMLEQLDSSYNLIMSSLGPKLTAISLYQLQREKQEIGLVYAPSNQFSEEYSSGIGKCFKGILKHSTDV